MVNFNVVAKRQVRDASVSEATDLKTIYIFSYKCESPIYILINILTSNTYQFFMRAAQETPAQEISGCA